MCSHGLYQDKLGRSVELLTEVANDIKVVLASKFRGDVMPLHPVDYAILPLGERCTAGFFKHECVVYMQQPEMKKKMDELIRAYSQIQQQIESSTAAGEPSTKVSHDSFGN